MSTSAEYPYDDYYLFVVFHKTEGRRYAVLYPKDAKKNKRTTMSYARYLMSVNERRFLAKEEQVDHIDNDRTNDSISNLQILTPKQNRDKYNMNVYSQMVMLKCPNCGKIFSRRRGNTFLVTNGNYSTCSKRCNGQFTMKRILGTISDSDYERLLSENVIKEYRLYKTTEW